MCDRVVECIWLESRSGFTTTRSSNLLASVHNDLTDVGFEPTMAKANAFTEHLPYLQGLSVVRYSILILLFSIAVIIDISKNSFFAQCLERDSNPTP